LDGFRRLDGFVRAIECGGSPMARFDAAVAHERALSPSLGGRTVLDRRVPAPTGQMSLF
jgi:hypothetical protein